MLWISQFAWYVIKNCLLLQKWPYVILTKYIGSFNWYALKINNVTPCSVVQNPIKLILDYWKLQLLSIFWWKRVSKYFKSSILTDFALCKEIQMALGFQILAYGFRIPTRGSQISIVDSGFQPQGFRRNGFWIPYNGFGIPRSGFRIPKLHVCWIPDSGFLHMGR